MAMRLNLENPANTLFIRGYTENTIKINDQVFSHSIIVTTQQVTPWDVNHFNALSPENFQVLAELDVEIIILGTGAKQRFPSMALAQTVIAQQKSLEVMNNGAACRTYNILAADGRKVAVAILLENN